MFEITLVIRVAVPSFNGGFIISTKIQFPATSVEFKVDLTDVFKLW